MDNQRSPATEIISDSYTSPKQLLPSSFWLIASLVGHVLVLLIAVLLSQTGGNEPEAAAERIQRNKVSTAKLAQLNDQIRDQQKLQLAEKVESLQATARAMQRLEQQKNGELRQAFPEQVGVAGQDLANKREAAIAAQRQALQQIQEANRVGQEPESDPQDGDESGTAASESQLAAEQRMNELAAAFALNGQSQNGFGEVFEKQVQASQALAAVFAHDHQLKSAKANFERQKQQQENRNRNEAKLQQQIDNLNATLKKHRDKLELAKAAIEAAKVDADSQAAKLSKLQTRKNDAAMAFDQAQTASGQARQQVQELRNQKASKDDLQKAQQALMKAQQEQKRKLAERQQAANDFNRQKQKANIAENQIKVAQQKAKANQRQVDSALGQIENAQANFDKFQKNNPPVAASKNATDYLAENAAEKRQSLLEQAVQLQQQALAAHESFDAQSVPEVAAYNADGEIDKIYKHAESLEREITSRFKNIRSAELALVQKMELGQARSLVGVASPERNFDPESLTRTAKTPDELREIAASLDQANRQVAAMDEFTKSLLAKSNALERQGLSIDLESRRESDLAMRSRSSQSDGGDVVDMTGLMATAQSDDDPKSDKGQAGDQERLTQQYTVVNAPTIKATAAPEIMKKAVPARRFGSSASTAQSGWSFIDSWYILGPFDNADRKNIHHRFPPESIVDLDAKYPSKATGGAIGWKFYQSSGPKVEPRAWQGEYVIYYAFTEIYFAEDTDVWIAVGSDDRSDIWINDVPVWSSSDVLKEWQINEGLRCVRFKAGLNRVLYRIENGNGPWAFSFCLSLSNQEKVR